MASVNITKLEEYMENNNINMPQLAEKLNVEYSYFYRIMKGERTGGGNRPKRRIEDPTTIKIMLRDNFTCQTYA